MKGSCMVCGFQPINAAKAVAIFDVVLGASTFLLTLFCLHQIRNGNEDNFWCNLNSLYVNGYDSLKHSQTPSTGKDGTAVPEAGWLPIVILGCAGVQFFLGFVLYAAAVTKSRRVCQLWVVATAPTCLIIGFYLRIYEVLVIIEFVQALEKEQSQADVSSSVIVTQPAIAPQQLQMQPQLSVPGTEHVAGRNIDYTRHQYRHQQSNHTISYISSATSAITPLSIYASTTPPSYVAPPPYHKAIACSPATY